ncbi:lactoylglutathione lyase [Tistrella mobilis]|uniref:Aldoketomutase n=1 Tax=Tistrella mobilis (strain KA081020-065) TaxID=1110502 RepID=I3TSQ8_TISMK|nr:lactoylglutathione lyase [Tistrella mobilis]AFK55796.1 lactoylglutathione lyase [Tistrella mobilis KA081020-065]
MRVAYTMIRVADLDRSIGFYTQVLGMTLFRREDYPTGRFTLAFLGYGQETTGATVELTWNWDITAYDRGNAWGHIAIAVDDVYAQCARLEARGANLIRPAGPMAHLSPQRGGLGEIIAFLEDPDGYRIELVPAH